MIVRMTQAFHGLRIGVILRNSSPNQVGNFRSVAQVDGAVATIEGGGGEAVIYDEQGTSGRVLERRVVARRLLQDVVDKVVDGVYAHDLSRLTRDEWGADAGTIARALAKARAPLITAERTYSLWLKSDLLLYRIQTAIAGGELLDIRDRMVEGRNARARREAFFQGPTPWGYATRVEERQGGKSLRLLRVPQRDESVATMVRDLGMSFDTAVSLGDVALAMNQRGHRYRIGFGPDRGKDARWTITRLKFVLANDLYGGRWSYRGEIEHERPDLAWWPMADLERWRAKFAQAEGETRRRVAPRNLGHLRGILNCASCGRLLASSGQNGYRCTSASCTQVTNLSHGVAWRMCRQAFAEAVESAGGMIDALRQEAKVTEQLDIIRRRQADVDATIGRIVADWYSGQAGTVPVAVLTRMREMQAERERLEQDAMLLSGSDAIPQELEAILGEMARDPVATLEALPEDAQATCMRYVLRNVRITYTGWGWGVRHAVAFESLLDPTSATTAQRCVVSVGNVIVSAR